MNTFLGKKVLVYLAGILSKRDFVLIIQEKYRSLAWTSRHEKQNKRKQKKKKIEILKDAKLRARKAFINRTVQ